MLGRVAVALSGPEVLAFIGSPLESAAMDHPAHWPVAWLSQ
jgi:hypothetical protein